MLKLGNCLDLIKEIPDNSIDLVVTDPPYKITARGNGGNSGGMFQKKIVNSGYVFAHNELDIADWIDEVYRVLKDSAHCYIMTNNRNIYHYLDVINKSKFHYVKCLVWVKDNKIMGQTYMSQFEFIIMLRKGKHKKINYCGTSDVLMFPNNKLKDEDGKTIHDTEKPVDLAIKLIENSSNAGDTVLDPFMGINSTGIACKLLGRKFIGFEINKKYFDVAKQREDEIILAN